MITVQVTEKASEWKVPVLGTLMIVRARRIVAMDIDDLGSKHRPRVIKPPGRAANMARIQRDIKVTLTGKCHQLLQPPAKHVITLWHVVAVVVFK